ncbi:MAG: hypothetical protein JW697_02520 [Kosmotogaceae bacterium]|nr:hypothetical protein [Kosmotogaceae bacterium]
MRSKYWIFAIVALVFLLTGCPFLNKLPVWTTIPDLIRNLGDSVNFSLSPYCSDPNGDPLTFSVASGPGTIVGSNYVWTVTAPTGEKTIVVSASDGKGSATASFKITVKTTPNIPSSPSPSNNSTDKTFPLISLSWTGGDPDGDTVTYDLYFGTSATPPLYSSNITSTSYNKGGLVSYTTYYWKIVAKDGLNSVSGPVWKFTTGPYTLVDEDFESRSLGIPVLPWATYESYGSTAAITNYGHPGRALTFVDSTVANWARVIRTGLNPVKKGTVRFDFRVSSNGCFGFRETVNWVPYVYIADAGSGYGIYSFNNDTGVFTKLMAISGGVWYNVYILFDLNSKYYSVYVNNVLKRTETLTGSYSITSFNFQTFNDSACTYVDIDNVNIGIYEPGFSPSSMEPVIGGQNEASGK